jgi:hypothetical protein
MIMDNLTVEKHCVALGGLDGLSFVENLSTLELDIGRLKNFVVQLNDAMDFAPKPIVSLGHEVDRDAVVIDHLDGRLTTVISGLIDLLATVRSAKAPLERAM